MKVRYAPGAGGPRNDLRVFRRACALNRAVSEGALERRIAMLADFPEMAPQTDQLGVYELTIVRYPYLVYYEISSEEVRILHIRDARRRPWSEEQG